MCAVEDEFHFLMRCKLYDNHRQKHLFSLSDIFDVDNLPPDQFILLN